MKRLTRNDKLGMVVEFITEGHLAESGGYPHDFVRIGDLLIVAGTDGFKEDNATSIEMFSLDALIWEFDAAAKCFKKEEGRSPTESDLEIEGGQFWLYFEAADGHGLEMTDGLSMGFNHATHSLWYLFLRLKREGKESQAEGVEIMHNAVCDIAKIYQSRSPKACAPSA